MNIYLQLGIGLVPGVFGIFFFLLKRRAFNLNKVCFAFSLLVCCGVLLGVGVYDKNQSKNAAPKISKEKTLQMANAMAAEGSYSLAGEVLTEYGNEFGYDSDSRLLTARIAAMRSDYGKATALYADLLSNPEKTTVQPNQEEIRYIERQSGTKLLSDSSIADSSSENEAPVEQQASGVRHTELDQEKQTSNTVKTTEGQNGTKNIQEELRDYIQKEIKEQYKIPNQVLKYAQNVDAALNMNTEKTDEIINATKERRSEEINETQNSDIGQPAPDAAFKENGSDIRRTFKTMMEEDPEYGNLECVSKAKTKIYVLTGSYDDIIKDLSDKSSYHEWITASEIYLNGLVDAKDFPQDYQMVSKADLNDIRQQLKDLYRKVSESGDYSKQELADLKKRVDALSSQLDDQTATMLKGQLSGMAEEDRNAEQSKTHLELSRIEDSVGNETAMGMQMNEAIKKAPESQDYIYQQEMEKLGNIINGTNDNLDSLTSIPDSIDTILDHSMTLGVSNDIAKQNPAQNEQDTKKTFDRNLTNYINTVRASVVIGAIDASNFSTVKARVCLANDDDLSESALKNAIKIYDCGEEITDYTLEKVRYTNANLMLLCDNSGSMDQSVTALKTAAAAFLENAGNDENIAFATFDNTLQQYQPFGSDKSSISAAIGQMNAFGGTALYNSVLAVLNDFPADVNANNILIAMTDGCDNEAPTNETFSQIAAKASATSTSIYTLGLGTGIDDASLRALAKSANGEFMYVTDDSSLETFFNKLHAQTRNQYILTYKALNTSTTSRPLRIVMPETTAMDEKTYYLPGSEPSSDNQISTSMGVTTDGNQANAATDKILFDQPSPDSVFSVTGVSPRVISKAKTSTEIRLIGTGFRADSLPSVKLGGGVADQALKVEYEDSEHCVLTVPADMGVGTYDVLVTYKKVTTPLYQAFEIKPEGDDKITDFGDYHFTSSNTITEGGMTILQGNVTMNGWLHFKGEIRLLGDLDAESIQLTDLKGSYITLDPMAATGNSYAELLLKKSIDLEIMPLETFKLHNDYSHSGDYDNYAVDSIETSASLLFTSLIEVPSPIAQLRPDCLELHFSSLQYRIDNLSKVFQGVSDTAQSLRSNSASGKPNHQISKDEEKSGFSVKLGSAKLSNRTLGLKGEATWKQKVSLFGVLSLEQLTGSIDTGKDKMAFNFEFGFPGVAEIPKTNFINGFEAEIGLKHMKFDAMKVTANGNIPIGSTPISVSSVNWHAEGLHTLLSEHSLSDFAIGGGMTLSCCRVQDLLPGVDIFGDAALLSTKDLDATLKLTPFNITAGGKLTLLGQIQLLDANLQLGNIENYSNALLGITEYNVLGVTASLQTGISTGSDNTAFALQLTGTGNFDAVQPFIGVGYTGIARIKLKFWVAGIDESLQGSSAFGLHLCRDNKWELVFKFQGTGDNGKTTTISAILDSEGHLTPEIKNDRWF